MGDASKKKILVVDDEPDICELLSEGLQHAGYEVVSVNTGMDGLNQAKKERPDLIILDICLPDIDGTVVYETLRATAQNEKTPVIFLTALATGTEARIGPANDSSYMIIGKPAKMEDIQKEIARLLGK